MATVDNIRGSRAIPCDKYLTFLHSELQQTFVHTRTLCALSFFRIDLTCAWKQTLAVHTITYVEMSSLVSPCSKLCLGRRTAYASLGI